MSGLNMGELKSQLLLISFLILKGNGKPRTRPGVLSLFGGEEGGVSGADQYFTIFQSPLDPVVQM